MKKYFKTVILNVNKKEISQAGVSFLSYNRKQAMRMERQDHAYVKLENVSKVYGSGEVKF